jgi:hypothetical protein
MTLWLKCERRFTYKNPTTKVLTSMASDVTSALIGALGGSAVGAMLTQILSNLSQARRERRQEIRTKVTEAVATIGTAQQYMEWISWFGVNYPVPNPKFIRSDPNIAITTDEKLFESPNKTYSQRIAELAAVYEAEMKDIWPKVLSSLSVLASYDAGSYRKLKALVDELASLDVAITVANMKKETACRTDYEGIKNETTDIDGKKKTTVIDGIYTSVRRFGDKLASELEEISKSIGTKGGTTLRE